MITSSKCISVCCLTHQAQHGARMAAAVALLWPISTQSAPSEARSSVRGVTSQRAPRLRLSEADAELAEVRSVCCIMRHKHAALHAQMFE